MFEYIYKNKSEYIPFCIKNLIHYFYSNAKSYIYMFLKEINILKFHFIFCSYDKIQRKQENDHLHKNFYFYQ
jgi:hypothetical protein